MTGDWPNGVIDHINRDRTDNRWCNLRDVDYSLNSQNRGLQSNNTSGVVGVTWHNENQMWEVRLYRKSVCIYRKFLNDFTEAVKLRFKKEQEMYPDVPKKNSSAYLYLKKEGVIDDT